MRTQLLNACIDFDGVLCAFNGWVGEYTFGEPVEGAGDFLEWLSQRYRVVVCTARPDLADVWRWLNKHGMSEFVDEVTSTKPPAAFYLDDKALRFEGDFILTEAQIATLKNPWWKKED